jgi:precorrin-2/cobalt-factor-2 C20-methyltransferase
MEPGEEMSGTLYGLGLGPGDPELITLKAARLIAACPVVAYPRLAGGDSFARAIAAGLIAENAEEIAIDVPMSTDRAPAQAAYDAGAARIAAALEAGRDVACLCEGDPFFYGSFMYLHARLAARFAVEVVPGVTSLTACAARAGRPLAARNERVTVLPGPLPEAELRARIEGAESVAVMKLGRHMAKLRGVIEALGLTGQATYVERATLAEERICPLAEAPETAPYFSMILIAKGADPWL